MLKEVIHGAKTGPTHGTGSKNKISILQKIKYY
jgi:hypothetical protein